MTRCVWAPPDLCNTPERLGRAYAARHAATLGLPPSPADWGDTQVPRALLQHGHDAVGNLLLAPRSGDALPCALPPPTLHASEPNAT